MKPSPELLYQYKQARRQAIEDCRMRTEKVRSDIPRLGEIARQKRSIAYDMGREILEKGEAARTAAMERIAALDSEEAAILMQAGYPGDYFSPRFRCGLCEDTGYVGELYRTPCACLRRRMAEARFASSAIDKSQSFAAFREDIYPTDKQRRQALKAKDICYKYAQSYPDQSPRDLLIIGSTGLGKSHLLNAIGLELAARGAYVYKTTAYNLINSAMDAIKERSSAPDFIAPDVLIIDDLGTESMIPNITRETFFTVINERQTANKATLWATNRDLEFIQESYGDRFFSRLIAPRNTGILAMSGDDLRPLLK
ncbi:MAG: ATP-binding protein [Clostridia bacterium]|nr:ATP-binding protein [Clostridia bacterium]